MSVHVLESRELSVLRREEGVVDQRTCSVFVAINANVRVPSSIHGFDVESLLAGELDVIAVGIEACGEITLEVGDTVGVVAWDYEEVGLFEHLLGPGGIVVELSKEGHDGLVATRFVAVDGTVNVDPELVRAAAIEAFGVREPDVRNGAAFFGCEVGRVVGHPAVAIRKALKETFEQSLASWPRSAIRKLIRYGVWKKERWGVELYAWVWEVCCHSFWLIIQRNRIRCIP